VTETTEALAYFLFERQAMTYTGDKDYIAKAWAKWEIREFWMDEAEAIIGFLLPAVK
jgi:uncharacterized membrane protein